VDESDHDKENWIDIKRPERDVNNDYSLKIIIILGHLYNDDSDNNDFDNDD